MKAGGAAVAAAVLGSAGCDAGKKTDPARSGEVPGTDPGAPPPPGAGPEAPPKAREWNLSELAPPPDWTRLEVWQESITAAEFRDLLENVMTEGTAFWSTVEQQTDRAVIRTSTARAEAPRFELRFAREKEEAAAAPAVPAGSLSPPSSAGNAAGQTPGAQVLAGPLTSGPAPAAAPARENGQAGPVRTVPPAATAEGRAKRYWRRAAELPPPSRPDRPLEGLRVAVDPGHIGGAWAKMEGRWYRMGTSQPVMEGALTLTTALHLKPLLTDLGAEVSLVRDAPEPLTRLQPEALLAAARESLEAARGRDAVLTEVQILKEAERLFYRTSEIRARGQRVNEVLCPDLVVCLHYNAESWGGDAEAPAFSPANHLHVLAHGCLSPAEFMLDDQRLDTLLRMLQGIPREEIRLCDAVARSLAAATGLPAYTYTGRSARRVNDNPWLWARNLLANRVYHCPVIFTEPYVMNNQAVFDRIQAGDYEGEKEVAGRRRRSIFREYAGAVADGLAEACLNARTAGA